MDDATQKLVDDAMRRAPMRITDEGIVMQASEIEAMIADALALEAAQRPPVSGEYTHVVNLARASEAADKGLDALIDYLADLPTVGEWRPPVSPEQREVLLATVRAASAEYLREDLPEDGRDEPDTIVDAILARFSLPVLDVEKVARRLAYYASDWTHNDCGDNEHYIGHTNWTAWADDAAALIAALPTLTAKGES